MQIALKHLLPRQLREHRLTHPYLDFTPPAVNAVVDGYTREAGVRNLERELSRACRKLAKLRQEGEQPPSSITVDEVLVPSLLGPRRFVSEAAEGEPRVGVATGLV